MKEINIAFDLGLLRSIFADLEREHCFAYERVGFLFCEYQAESQTLMARAYKPVSDGDYLRDRYVGACIGVRPIRAAVNAALGESAAVFHVHAHSHIGVPYFSGVDEGFYEELMPALRAVNPDVPHGALLLSKDSVRARIWEPGGAVRDYEAENLLLSKERKYERE